MTTTSSGPAREPDPSAPTGWTPIDTRLSDVGSHVEPKTTVAPITFSDGGAGALATLTVDDGATVTQPWSGSLPAPRIEGAPATYPDVYPGVDLVLRAQTEGFEQSWVINSRPAVPVKLDVPLALKGLTVVTKPDDTVELVDAQGNLRASADPALMWDATVDPATGEPANQVTVPTNLVKTGSGRYVLEVEPDQRFLDSAG